MPQHIIFKHIWSILRESLFVNNCHNPSKQIIAAAFNAANKNAFWNFFYILSLLFSQSKRKVTNPKTKNCRSRSRGKYDNSKWFLASLLQFLWDVLAFEIFCHIVTNRVNVTLTETTDLVMAVKMKIILSIHFQLFCKSNRTIYMKITVKVRLWILLLHPNLDLNTPALDFFHFSVSRFTKTGAFSNSFRFVKDNFFKFAILEQIIMLTQAPVDESAIFAALNKNLKKHIFAKWKAWNVSLKDS